VIWRRGYYVCGCGGPTFENWRLAAEQGFTLIIARAEFTEGVSTSPLHHFI